MSGRTKRSQGRDERRSQLLDAARKVFAVKGFHAATVDDITRAAGVAKGTFYLYFAEKRTIFYELIQRFFDMVIEAGMSVAADVITAEDFLKHVEQAARRLATIFRENRDLVRLTYRESMSMDERLERMVREFYRRMGQIEADNIRLGVKLGLLRDDIDPLVAAFAQIGMVERVLLQWMFDRSSPEIPDLVRQVVELAYRGMHRCPAPSA